MSIGGESVEKYKETKMTNIEEYLVEIILLRSPVITGKTSLVG